ncbi:sulfotransferase family 2 domain-containing protein [Zhouia amylolytica]|uniref:Sulfotransferase family protein n=1 Tax=Zhouia amylolytica AD3 TaxID=1286632 RepID=W2UQP8_9FLAO|nr:sulfotransferase family 2 domain-containing protein [Zhouia amylolytica]ETN95796.1 hypothetical protein P278_15180 [Zhouia amylolytica AD3]
MICHKSKVIYIHIPKCAGSSIENYFGVHPFDWKTPNYETLTGWCPKRKIHLQHATAKQLLELELVDEKIWNSYYKFTVVRNPWERILSAYFWFNGNKVIKSSFRNFLNKEGLYKKTLTDFSVKEYRGDHLLSQYEFITINDQIMVDKIIPFENLKIDFFELVKNLGLTSFELPHRKERKKAVSHYSHFFNGEDIELIKDKYSLDIQMLKYKYEDKRNELSTFEKFKINFGRLTHRI